MVQKESHVLEVCRYVVLNPVRAKAVKQPKEIIAKNLRLPNADAVGEFYLEAQEELDRKPYPTIEGTRTVLKFVAERNPRVAAIKAEEVVDLSWLKKLDDEGFFDKV